jgi:glycosyltransferase involved in cell wall biosynthesis
MYIDGALVPAGLLVNGRSILKAEHIDEVHYFHLELDAHDVIIAEGALSETFVDDDSRGMFHNAHEFRALYPDAPTNVPVLYCAPRVEDGTELEDFRRRLLGRARRLKADGTAAPVTLRSGIDHVSHARIAGWAFDPATPHARIAVVAVDHGAVIGRALADLYRPDLEEAGIGDGLHGFELIVPGGLATDIRHEIQLFREIDWTPLTEGPFVLEPIAAGTVPLGDLQGHLDHASPTRICGWAKDMADDERRVGLVVSVDDQIIGRILANRYRGDVEEAGFGDGRYGFDFVIPHGLSALETHVIRVRREADGAELTGSPIALPAACRFDGAVEQTLANLLSGASAASDADEDRALAFLAEQTERLLSRRAERQSGRAEREAERLFRRRWGPEAVAIHGDETAKGGRLGPRALIVDDLVPDAHRDAGSVAILSHIRALRALGYEVTFVASQDMHNSGALAALAAAEGIAACGIPHYSCVEDVLSRQAGTFELVYLHRCSNADRYLTVARDYCPKARLVYGVADLHHLRLARQAQVERRSDLLAFSRRVAAMETSAAQRANVVITHSPVEAEMLRELGIKNVAVVPFDLPRRQVPKFFGKRHGIAFIGSHGHTPNPDAVQHLIDEVLPLVWQQDPTITCEIVGHGWRKDLLSDLDSRIEIVGAIEDLGALFDTVRLTVAPLRFGAGIKGKVLASFAAGVPCVMTPIAAEGLPLDLTLPQLVGRTSTELARRIVQFHADETANVIAGYEGIGMVAREFSSERVREAMSEAVPNRSPTPLAEETHAPTRKLPSIAA